MQKKKYNFYEFFKISNTSEITLGCGIQSIKINKTPWFVVNCLKQSKHILYIN